MVSEKNKGRQHFTFIAKVKPGRAKNIRANAAKRNEIAWEEMDKLLKPLTLHTGRWLLFDNDTRFSSTMLHLTQTLTSTLTTRPGSLLHLGLQDSFRDLEGVSLMTRLRQVTLRLTGSF